MARSGYTWLRNRKIKYALNYAVYTREQLYYPFSLFLYIFFTNLTQFAAHKFATTGGAICLRPLGTASYSAPPPTLHPPALPPPTPAAVVQFYLALV